MTTENDDIEVLITFLSSEAGGRKTPAFEGYRPQFYYSGHDWDAHYHFQMPGPIWPGQTVRATLSFISPQYHVGQLHPGRLFHMREGSRTIAHGEVTALISLVQSATQQAQQERKRYFQRYWPEDRGDQYAAWGGAMYYFVCLPDGVVERQIERYDNGIVLSYDDIYEGDEYGALSEKPLDLQEFTSYEISGTTFWQMLTATRAFNRPL